MQVEMNMFADREHMRALHLNITNTLCEIYAATVSQLPDNPKTAVIIDQLVTLNRIYDAFFLDFEKTFYSEMQNN